MFYYFALIDYFEVCLISVLLFLFLLPFLFLFLLHFLFLLPFLYAFFCFSFYILFIPLSEFFHPLLLILLPHILVLQSSCFNALVPVPLIFIILLFSFFSLVFSSYFSFSCSISNSSLYISSVSSLCFLPLLVLI